MGAGAKGVGGEGRETGREYEGKFENKEPGARAIEYDNKTPGSDHVGEPGSKKLPDDVRKAAEEYDSNFSADTAPKSSPHDAPSLADFFGDPLSYLRETLAVSKADVGEPTRVNSTEARRASNHDPVIAPMEYVQHPDGTVELVQTGEAGFVDVETVKKRAAAIDNESSWSESARKAVGRKAAQLEPKLLQDHKAEYKKALEEKSKDDLDLAKVKEKYVKQGKSDVDAERLAKQEIGKKKAEIDKEAEKRAKPVAKEDAKKQAADWYKDAAPRRRQAEDARVEELLPSLRERLSKKYPKARPDWLEHVARNEAQRQAKAEWDQRLKEAKEDLPVVVDTNLPGIGADYLRQVDHHGPFLKKADGSAQKANATMQMLNLYESALRAAGVTDLNHPTDAQVADAMRRLNLKQVSTDNLGDGAWSVWMAKHQAEVMKDPSLRSMIRRATYFEDYAAFSQGRYDRHESAVELQASLFSEYGRILKENGVSGSDRIPADKADKIMKETMAAMDKMIENPGARTATAEAFWKNVDAARAKAQQAEIPLPASPDGKTRMKAYDLRQLGEFTIFEQWLAIPDIYRQRPVTDADGDLAMGPDGHPQMGPADALPVQMTVAAVMVPKMGTDGKPETGPDGKPVMVEDPTRTQPIVAVPFGNRLATKQGLLTAVDALNKAEKAKADALGVPANIWFGRADVILANPMGGGSRLSAAEIADIVTDPKFHLFDEKVPAAPIADGKGDSLKTPDGRLIRPLSSHYESDVKGFTARQAYREGSKLIDEYGVGRNSLPRAKGERLLELAQRGDARAEEALGLLYQIKGEGDTLVHLSEQGGGEQWLDVPMQNLKSNVARFKALVADLGPALDGKATVAEDQKAGLKEKAGEADKAYENRQNFQPTATDVNGSPQALPQGQQRGPFQEAEAWSVYGNDVQKRAAGDVLEAAKSNKEILRKIDAFETALKKTDDPVAKSKGEKALSDLYGILGRNMKTIERWEKYMGERKEFDHQIASFEIPYISMGLLGGMSFLGYDISGSLGVVDITTRSPEYYEDINAGIGKTPGDYQVTIWVKTSADQARILGDIWTEQSKTNPNRVKWGRDGQGRFLRILDAQGREYQVHVQTPQKAEAVPAAPAAPAPQADAVQYDLAARRVSKGSSTDVTSNGK